MTTRKNRNKDLPIQGDSEGQSLFVTDLEDQLFFNIADELLNNIIQSFVLYYQIDETKSEVSDIYGETTKLVFKNPVKLFAFIEEPEPTLETNKFGMDQKKMIYTYIHKRRLEEFGLMIHEGDWIGYNGQNYEIVSTIDVRYIGGVSRFRDTIKLTCIVPDSNQQLNQ